MAAHNSNIVLCDNGTGRLKCGFPSDHFPTGVLPCVVGYPKASQQSASQRLQGSFVGQQVLQHASQLDATWPIRNGMIYDWREMTAVWSHAFSQVLQVQPSDCRILLTEPLYGSATSRSAMLDVMFETFGFQAASIQIQPVLTLLAVGEMTGLAVDVGAGIAQVVPVIEGYPYLQHCRKTNIAGQEVSSHLLELLQRRGYDLSPTSDLQHVADAKRLMCYVSCDYQQDVKLVRETTVLVKSYTLPDGRTIKVGPERFAAPEVLFNPRLASKEQPGLAQMAFQCVQDMTIDTRRKLYENVVLSGGCTMLPGLPTRLENELKALYLEHTLKGDRAGLAKLRLKVHDAADRQYQVFRGAAMLANIMQDKASFWISKQEWREDPTRALGKCGVLDPVTAGSSKGEPAAAAARRVP